MSPQPARKWVTPGVVLYHVCKRLKHGLRTAYYRDIVRRQILKTRPVRPFPSDICEIHVMTSADDWLNLIWALKSFYHYSQRNYSLCIHDDGTLPASALATLGEHFPAARFVSRQEADSAVLSALAPYPHCMELRRTNKLSLKLFDFRHYLQASRMLLIDSDILFFAEPTELLRRIDDPFYGFNTVNPDAASTYTVEPALVAERLGFELKPCLNSGLGLMHPESLRLDWIEEFLSLPGIVGHFWRIEQTLFALCSSRYGAELLPEEYRVKLDGESKFCCKHYVGPIRPYMYRIGIQRLLRQGFLKEAGA